MEHFWWLSNIENIYELRVWKAGKEKVDSYKKVESCDASLNQPVCVTDVNSRQIAANYCKNLKTATHDMWVIGSGICVQLSRCSHFYMPYLPAGYKCDHKSYDDLGELSLLAPMLDMARCRAKYGFFWICVIDVIDVINVIDLNS